MKLFEVINELGGQSDLFDFDYPINTVTNKTDLENHFVRRYRYRDIEFSDSATFKYFLEELWLERIIIFNERVEVQAEVAQLDRLTTVRTEKNVDNFDQPDTVTGSIQADNKNLEVMKGFEGQAQLLAEQHMALFRNIEEEFIDSLEELFSGLFDTSDILTESVPVSGGSTGDFVTVPFLEGNYSLTSDIDSKNTQQDLEIVNNSDQIDLANGRIDNIEQGALGKQVFTQSNLQSSLIIDNDKRDEWQKITFLEEIETDSDVIEFKDLDDQWVFKQDGVVQLGGVYQLERDQSGDINLSLKLETTEGVLVKQIDVIWDGSNEFFRGVFSNAFRITTELLNKNIEIFIRSNKRVFVNRFEPLFVQTITSGFTTDNVQYKDVEGLSLTNAIVDTLTINQVVTNPGDPVEDQVTIDEGSDEEVPTGKALINQTNTIKNSIDTNIETMLNLSNPIGTIKSFETSAIGDQFITDMEQYNQTWEKLVMTDGFALVSDSVGGLEVTSGQTKRHTHLWETSTADGTSVKLLRLGGSGAFSNVSANGADGGGANNLAAGLKVVYYKRIA